MAEEKDKEGSAEWMQKYWRPAMGWMYMLICLLDMAIFPILWSLLQAMMHMPITQWNPLTLQGAGLFHIAMGAVLGISAFGRTQEKLAGTAANPTTTQTITQNNNASNVPATGFGGFNNGNTTTPATGFSGGATAFGAAPAGFGAPAGGFGASATATGGFGSPAPSGGFGSSSGFGATTAPAATGVTTGFGGKPAPVMPPDPVL